MKPMDFVPVLLGALAIESVAAKNSSPLHCVPYEPYEYLEIQGTPTGRVEFTTNVSLSSLRSSALYFTTQKY